MERVFLSVNIFANRLFLCKMIVLRNNVIQRFQQRFNDAQPWTFDARRLTNGFDIVAAKILAYLWGK